MKTRLLIRILRASPEQQLAIEHLLCAVPPENPQNQQPKTATPAPLESAMVQVLSGIMEQTTTVLNQNTTVLNQTTAVLEQNTTILHEIATVRHDFTELRTAKERLEKMQAEGLFAFTNRVDARSFKILCAILAHGDIAKAARALQMPTTTLRSRLGTWKQRAAPYPVLLDLIRWRKKVGRKQLVPLNDAILHETAPTADYPALLSDVLDGILSMTDANWQDVSADLAALLRSHRPKS